MTAGAAPDPGMPPDPFGPIPLSREYASFPDGPVEGVVNVDRLADQVLVAAGATEVVEVYGSLAVLRFSFANSSTRTDHPPILLVLPIDQVSEFVEVVRVAAVSAVRVAAARNRGQQ